MILPVHTPFCCKVPLFLLTDTWAFQHGIILELIRCVGRAPLCVFLKASEAASTSLYFPGPSSQDLCRGPETSDTTLALPDACLPASQAWNRPWTRCHFIIVASCLWSQKNRMFLWELWSEKLGASWLLLHWPGKKETAWHFQFYAGSRQLQSNLLVLLYLATSGSG